MFRAFSRLSSGSQWLQWQPLVLPSYRGDCRAVFVVGHTVHTELRSETATLSIVGATLELVRNGERSGRVVPNDIIPAHVWKEWGNPRKYVDRMIGVQAEIRNVPLPNASNKLYGLRNTWPQGDKRYRRSLRRATPTYLLNFPNRHTHTHTHKHCKQPSLRMSSDFPDFLNGWVTELSLYVYLRIKITELRHHDGNRGLSDSEKCHNVIWVTPQNNNYASNSHQTPSRVLPSISWYCTIKIIHKTLATICQTVRCHESDVWFGCKWRGGHHLSPNVIL